MSMLQIRKIVIQIEETHRAAGRDLPTPTRKIVAAAVINNPFAGTFVEDLRPLYSIGADVSGLLAKRALEAAGIVPGAVTAYGKGAIVGTAGELEHTAALLHPSFGGPVRAALGGGAAIIPGTKKIGGLGASITMPLANKDDIWQFDEMDSAEIAIPDAPFPDEILIAVCFGVGGRPLHRVTKA